MHVIDAVKEISSHKGVGAMDFARHEGVARQTVANRFNRRDIRMGTLCKMLDLLGYRVAIVPTHSILAEGCYFVDAGNEEGDGCEQDDGSC